MEGYIIIAVVAVILAIVLGLSHRSMDEDRIRAYVERGGGTLIDAKWRPLGPGWIDTKDTRIYEVHYLDKDGNKHHAYCKTSGWSGVCFTEDSVEGQTDRKEDQSSLEEENRRLREEVERLKRGQG